MSPSEKSAYDAEMAAAKGKLAEIRVAKDDLAVIEKAAEISAAIGGVQGEGGGLGVKDRSQRLSFKNMAPWLPNVSWAVGRRWGRPAAPSSLKASRVTPSH
jgi:hypothetical protein